MIRTAGWMSALLLAAMAPGMAAAQDAKPDKNGPVIESAVQAVKDGHPDRAIELLTPVLADYDRQYAGSKQMIFCGMTPGETITYMAMAASAKRDAIAVGANYCTARYVHAFALVDLKRPDEALAAFRKLVDLAPMHARYINELGYLLQQKRDFPASIEMYRRAEDAAAVGDAAVAAHERCVALRGIGYDLVELGKLDEAEAAYRKCLTIEPNDPKSLGELEYIEKQRRNAT